MIYCRQCYEPINIPHGEATCEDLRSCAEEGHNHTDVCVKRRYMCRNLHQHVLSLVNSCQECGWKGKERCICCIKVKQWPKEAVKANVQSK